MLIVVHGSSVRALVKHLDNVSDADIMALNIPTGSLYPSLRSYILPFCFTAFPLLSVMASSHRRELAIRQSKIYTYIHCYTAVLILG